MSSNLTPNLATKNPQDLPHGIEGIIAYPFDWSWVVYLFLFLFFGGLLVYFYRRFKKPKIKPVKKINLPLNIYNKVLALEPQLPFSKKEQEEYFYQLSFSLRHYIELKRDIPATDMTFNELKKPLESKLNLSEEMTKEVFSFLKKAEFIKFAHKVATREEALKLRSDVLEWMDQLGHPSEQEDK